MNKEISNCRDLLNGNINRIIVTNDSEELEYMYKIAKFRLTLLYELKKKEFKYKKMDFG